MNQQIQMGHAVVNPQSIVTQFCSFGEILALLDICFGFYGVIVDFSLSQHHFQQ